MSAPRRAEESALRRGCFGSGLLAVIALIILRSLAFRLPPLGIIILAGVLWLFFLMLFMRWNAQRTPRSRGHDD